MKEPSEGPRNATRGQQEHRRRAWNRWWVSVYQREAGGAAIKGVEYLMREGNLTLGGEQQCDIYNVLLNATYI